MTSAMPVTPTFRLDGKRALVTGASSGIGEAAAIGLAEAGAEVVLAARRAGPMEATVAALRGRGLKACGCGDGCDGPGGARGRRSRSSGPFDILVNNAGRNTRQPFLEVTDEALDAMLDLNVRAAFTVAQAVARGMVAARRGGVIINMGSVNGHIGRETISVYTATKHAIEGLTKGMAIELGAHGIRVVSLCPTWIETPLVRPDDAGPGHVRHDEGAAADRARGPGRGPHGRHRVSCLPCRCHDHGCAAARGWRPDHPIGTPRHA